MTEKQIRARIDFLDWFMGSYHLDAEDRHNIHTEISVLKMVIGERAPHSVMGYHRVGAESILDIIAITRKLQMEYWFDLQENEIIGNE